MLALRRRDHCRPAGPAGPSRRPEAGAQPLGEFGHSGGMSSEAHWFRIAAIAEAVSTMLADPELRRRYGDAGRTRATSRYTWRRIAADTTRVYERLAARHQVTLMTGER